MQSEQVLENKLVKQLTGMNYALVTIRDEKQLFANLKSQLEKLNKLSLSDSEFKQILNALEKGNVFDKAKSLRDRLQITRDDQSSAYIQFLDAECWQNNHFQVTQQVTIEGRYKNRYDVTLLVNGLPLVQIELKRRGLELKEAFNQINRYQKHSYWASNGLFQYVQLFMISNGVNTKYYANNRRQSFKQTFYWADVDNKRITELSAFTTAFLEQQHLSTLLNLYVVLNETDKILMVLRPYQIYATEAIVDRVKTSDKNGYIWHTTGSGKTLTSFKTAQILTASSEVDKVVFVVDRKDLDYQTSKEFNSFAKGSVDSTDNTKMLVAQFSGEAINTKKLNENRNTKLIVTTIQKLNAAISKKHYLKKMEQQKDQRIVFIFDECHRSQFGETHQRITKFFTNHQLFGFTGTPIFADNAVAKAAVKQTTKDLFDDCLHKYTIVDAIKDENVLKFNVEYVGKYTKKDSVNEVDIDVEGIDTKELLDSPQRLDKIADYIIAQHDRKTQSKSFTAMFCVSSVPTLIKYYELFKAKKESGQHQLKIATIFSYAANEEDMEANGLLPDQIDLSKVAEVSAGYGMHTRDKLEEFIGDYNEMFACSYTTKDSQSFYNYYNDISKKVRDRKVDILLVVNMFLTGFDSQPLNTLYVDKNLKHHGLIQAFSRTNRILNEQKSQGNIICFRNLKKATDAALTLFSNKNAKETVLMPSYQEFIKLFNRAYGGLLAVAPDLESIDELKDEEAEFDFVTKFRELMRLRNILSSFADFSFSAVKMDEQDFEDYKSKYLDIYDKVKTNTKKEKDSILLDVDFELELIQRDEINVTYILNLIAQLKSGTEEEQAEYRKAIVELLGGDPNLRSKKILIEKFIKEQMANVDGSVDITDEFELFWEVEKQASLKSICQTEHLDEGKFNQLIDDFIFSGKSPLRDDIIGTLETKPKLLEREEVYHQIEKQFAGYVDTFYMGMS